MPALKLQCIKIDAKEVELFVPQPETVQRTVADQAGNLYWARVWPASIALSRFLLSHLHLIRDKILLELGAGLGLPSLVAAPFAKHVYCSDHSSEAMEAVAASVTFNKITNISCTVYSWQQFSELPKVDVLLLSDVAYDPENFDSLHAVINSFLNNNVQVIISTPQRLTARKFMDKLMQWCTFQQEFIIKEPGSDVYTTVFLLEKKLGQ